MPASPPLVRPLSRRTLLALAPVAAVTGVLAGCSATSDGEAGTPGGDEQPYGVTVTTPDDGQVTIDRFPGRIAALNGNRVIPFLLPFLSTDHQLVGYGGNATPEDFPWIADQLEGLPQSVDADGPSVEAYASWEPDLLLANGNLGDYWEPARALGTLVQLPETDWRASTRLLGEVFKDPDAAESLLQDPLFTAAAPVAAGRVVVLDAAQSAAGFPVTPPTVPVVLESLAPVLGR